MSRYYELSDDGQVVPSAEWSRRDNRVAADTLPSGVYVSTVFLSLDHSFGDGPPLIFETMIFGGPLADEQWRYSTLEEARAGHAKSVKAARKAEQPWNRAKRRISAILNAALGQ